MLIRSLLSALFYFSHTLVEFFLLLVVMGKACRECNDKHDMDHQDKGRATPIIGFVRSNHKLQPESDACNNAA